MKFIVATLAAFALLAGSAVAQDRMTEPKSQFAPDAPAPAAPAGTATRLTPKELLSQGFEIKTVTIVPHDIVLRGGSTLDVDAVIMMLQNGANAAQCYMTYESYVNGGYFGGQVPSCTLFK